MLRASLEALAKDSNELDLIVSYCEIWVLRLAGFLPDVARCSACRKALGASAGGAFLGPASALKCARCAAGEGIAISLETLRHLKEALKSPPEVWARGRHLRADESAAELRQVLQTLTTRALEREPKLGRAPRL